HMNSDFLVFSYNDLKELVGKSPNLVLIDVRSTGEVARGCIPGSINIPIEMIDSALSMMPQDFKASYGVNKPELNAPELVFTCQSGGRAARATTKARSLGYTNARTYPGGYGEWSYKDGM
uniref:Rhodanese domain-containing protein n=1 Tax=Nothobranchius furzeri TaxID=105023 RepID=A0A8C6KRI1_NOTFU